MGSQRTAVVLFFDGDPPAAPDDVGEFVVVGTRRWFQEPASGVLVLLLHRATLVPELEALARSVPALAQALGARFAAVDSRYTLDAEPPWSRADWKDGWAVGADLFDVVFDAVWPAIAWVAPDVWEAATEAVRRDARAGMHERVSETGNVLMDPMVWDADPGSPSDAGRSGT